MANQRRKLAAALSAPLLGIIPVDATAQPTVSVDPVCLPLSWTTLGTAGGPIPTLDRSEPSNLLRAGQTRVLVDAGDGAVNNLARMGVDLTRVQAVFISHHHVDHYGGLLAVIGLAWMTSYPGTLEIYGPPGTAELVAGLAAGMGPQARTGWGFGQLSPPADMFRVNEMTDGASVTVGDLIVTARANAHFANETGEGVEGVSLSYRFEIDGRSITYTGDTGPSDAVTDLAAGSDLLVSEVMDFEALIAAMRQNTPHMPAEVFDQMAMHIRTHHLTGEQVGAAAGEAAVEQVLLTHYAVPPGPLENSADAILDGVRQHYSGPVHFGRDLASFDVGCNDR